MIKYYYTCEEDKYLIKKSFNNIALMIFGKNDQNRINAFYDYFERHVSQINVYPQGTITSHLTARIAGICTVDSDGKIIIEMLGYNGAREASYSFIKHEGTHEFCHSFVDLLSKFLNKHQETLIKNGVAVKNDMGMIKETDPITGEFVSQHYYGKMFNETMMDIITSMAINCYDSDGSVSSVDDILKNNYKDWGNATTGYSIFTSITRLAIAAFSNNGFTNYQNIVNMGGSMFAVETKMHDGSIKKANDFLYGIVFDQLHIEEEFDKIMGEGSYRKFCEYLDRLFVKSKENQKLPSNEVKYVMNILPDFLNKKIKYYRQKGIIDLKTESKIVGNFNKIWNSMQEEYGAYFSRYDIDEIAKRAGKVKKV